LEIGKSVMLAYWTAVKVAVTGARVSRTRTRTRAGKSKERDIYWTEDQKGEGQLGDRRKEEKEEEERNKRKRTRQRGCVGGSPRAAGECDEKMLKPLERLIMKTTTKNSPLSLLSLSRLPQFL